MLAKKLSIPVICKDDVVDALKTTRNINKSMISNELCYNILYSIMQTNLNLGANLILDIALGDRNNAKAFFDRLDFGVNNVTGFFIVCSDEYLWEERHLERINNPLPHQNFTSLEHIKEHYNKADFNPFEFEHIIDTSGTIEESFGEINRIVNVPLDK